MKSCAPLLIVVMVLGVASLGAADVPQWNGPWPGTFLYEFIPDPCWVAGEQNVVSPDYYVWSAYPEQAPQIYYLRTTLNGKAIDLAKDVILVQGAYMIPAEAVSKLGLAATFSPDNMTINITGKGHTLASTLYAARATVDGFSQPVKVASRWQRGKRYISLDLVAQAFNLVVTEDEGLIRISAY